MKRLDFLKTIAIAPAIIGTVVAAKAEEDAELLTSMQAIEQMRMSSIVQHVSFPHIYFFFFGGYATFSVDYNSPMPENWRDKVRIEGGRLGAIFQGTHENHQYSTSFRISLFAPNEERVFKVVKLPKQLRTSYNYFIKENQPYRSGIDSMVVLN